MCQKILILLLFLSLTVGCSKANVKTNENLLLGNEAIIIDHNCTNIKRVPKSWIKIAKANFKISYGHTSHGSQIISGMTTLQAADNFFSFLLKSS